MRKIEEQMLGALRAHKAWRSGNTEVTAPERLPEGYTQRVKLHGHEIGRVYFSSMAYREPFYLMVNLAGWNTNTTRSRLSALVRGFARIGRYEYGTGVSTKRGQAYLHDAHGKHEISDTGWHKVELEGG